MEQLGRGTRLGLLGVSHFSGGATSPRGPAPCLGPGRGAAQIPMVYCHLRPLDIAAEEPRA